MAAQQLGVRVSPELRNALVARALAENVSLSQLVGELLEASLAGPPSLEEALAVAEADSAPGGAWSVIEELLEPAPVVCPRFLLHRPGRVCRVCGV